MALSDWADPMTMRWRFLDTQTDRAARYVGFVIASPVLTHSIANARIGTLEARFVIRKQVQINPNIKMISCGSENRRPIRTNWKTLTACAETEAKAKKEQRWAVTIFLPAQEFQDRLAEDEWRR